MERFEDKRLHLRRNRYRLKKKGSKQSERKKEIDEDKKKNEK